MLNRQSYQRRAQEILARRRERWEQLPTEEKISKIQAHRERQRRWRNRWRAQLRRDPERYREQFAQEREWARDRELRQLFANLEQLSPPPRAASWRSRILADPRYAAQAREQS